MELRNNLLTSHSENYANTEEKNSSRGVHIGVGNSLMTSQKLLHIEETNCILPTELKNSQLTSQDGGKVKTSSVEHEKFPQPMNETFKEKVVTKKKIANN